MAVIADVVQKGASALSLNLKVSGVELRGELRAQDLALKLGREGGQISGAEISIEGFEIRSGEVKAEAASFSGKGVRIAWGEAGLQIVAESLSGPSLSLQLSAGRLQFGSWSVEGLSYSGGHLEVSRGAITDGKVDLRFGTRAGDESEKVQSTDAVSSPGRAKILDWRLFDALRGDFNVDLGVDLTVPVIGRRSAVHRFRVPIDAGAVNFMGLEEDLSTLENAILDFAVRSDDTLVLERGIPLLPTRGRGKPILIWRLSPEDLVLAKTDRIRLAVIPHFEVAGSEGAGGEDGQAEPKEESSSGLALRSLVLSNLETHLRLGSSARTVEGAPSFEADQAHKTAQIFDAAIRSLTVEQLSLLGQVQFHPGQEPKPGHLSGKVKGVETTLAELPLAAHTLSAAQLRVGALAALESDFLGLRPASLQCSLGDLSFQELRWAPSSPTKGD